MIYYILSIFIFISLLIYATVIFFSHKPRKPFPSELTYKTNDSTDKSTSITTENTNSKFQDDGIDISLVIPCYNETQRLGKC